MRFVGPLVRWATQFWLAPSLHSPLSTDGGKLADVCQLPLPIRPSTGRQQDLIMCKERFHTNAQTLQLLCSINHRPTSRTDSFHHFKRSHRQTTSLVEIIRGIRHPGAAAVLLPLMVFEPGLVTDRFVGPWKPLVAPCQLLRGSKISLWIKALLAWSIQIACRWGCTYVHPFFFRLLIISIDIE